MVSYELVRARVLVVIAVMQMGWMPCVYSVVGPPPPGVEVNFQLTSMSVGENASIINFTLGISGQDAMIVLGSLTMVSLTAMDGSASLNSDYGMLSTPIMSSTGESNVSGSIIIINDDTNEDTEMFTIHIDNCTNTMAPCVPGMMNLTIITIDDNDVFTVEPAMTALTVQEDQMAVIQLMNFAAPAGAVPFTITYITTNGTATGGMDYTTVTNGSVTIVPFSTIPNITVNITNDISFEDNETFFVNFTGCSPGCMIPSASDTVTVTIQDDEVAVGFQLTVVSVSEGDGSATFTLDISGPVDPTSTTTVYLTAFGGTADMNDYENLTNPITSSIGGTTVSGSVDIINDNINEDTEMLSLHIHNCTNTVAGCSVTLPYSTINITDDDISGTGQDPHFIVPLLGNQKFCYSMQGMANFAFNLVSDYFISINAYFVLPEEEKRHRFKEYATFLGDIGILIQQDDHRGKDQLKNMTKISISASDHSVTVDGIKTMVTDHSVNIVIDSRSTTVNLDKTVDGKTKPGLTVIVKEPKLSFKVTFVHNHIDLVFIDDSGISHDCHGIMGQFLHKEATVAEDKLLQINGRFIPIEKLPVWDFVHTNDTCLHAKSKHGFQAEGIIEGKYTDYIVESLFSPYFYYSKFKL